MDPLHLCLLGDARPGEGVERPVLLDFDLLVGVSGRSLDCRRLLARVGEDASLVGEKGRAGSLSSL